jgi:hypothetical protein
MLMRKEVGCPILDWRLPMTNFRLDVSNETGAATLWMATEETACGYKPILAWPSMEGIQEFARMLLEICSSRREEREGVEQISENIIRQALGEQTDFLKEEFND